MQSVTVHQAATMTRTSKSTINRAIKSGKLSAARDEHNVWKIDPAELARVMTVHVDDLEHHDAPDTTPNHDAPDRTNDAHHELQVEVRLLRQRLADQKAAADRERELLEAAVDRLEGEVDDWKKQSNNATLLLSHEQTRNIANESQKKTGWLSRLFG